MKNICLFVLLLIITNAFGQLQPGLDGQQFSGKPGVVLTYPDTTLRVVYVNKTSGHRVPAYYLNGKLVNFTFFDSIDPSVIDSVNIVKGSLQVGDVKYYGQVHIKTKSSYKPQIISLSDLKDKYTNLKSEPVLFTVDGEIVTIPHNDYMVDENRIWRVIVNRVDNDGVNLKFIQVLTKSEENFKRNKIRIRGQGGAVNE
jgi:hypothetical protein